MLKPPQYPIGKYLSVFFIPF